MSQRRDILQEHAELKDSVVARDATTATRRIQKQIQQSADSILESKAPIYDDGQLLENLTA